MLSYWMLWIKLIIKYCVSCWITDILQNDTRSIQYHITDRQTDRHSPSEATVTYRMIRIKLELGIHVVDKTQYVYTKESRWNPNSKNTAIWSATTWPARRPRYCAAVILPQPPSHWTLHSRKVKFGVRFKKCYLKFLHLFLKLRHFEIT